MLCAESPAAEPEQPRLFGDLVMSQGPPDEAVLVGPAASWRSRTCESTSVGCAVDEGLLEVFRRAKDPGDPIELRDLYLGQVEFKVAEVRRQSLLDKWTSSRVRRDVTAECVLASRSSARLIKELFNWYFRDDLYGDFRCEQHLILSSGSVDETIYGLPQVLKSCIYYALQRDWYGYSDSRGRERARGAIASLENAKLRCARYSSEHVAITMGGTFAMSGIADFVLSGRDHASPALCAIPNYPPLVASVARRSPTKMVPIESGPCGSRLGPLIDAVRPDTPLVLVQTVTNPTGAAVDERDLDRLIAATSPQTVVVLDECHEGLGPEPIRSRHRGASNVVRVSSASKSYSVPGLKLGWFVADSRFIDEFYEYASTSYGGPPSLLYTLAEVIARMERWLIEGRETTGSEELAEFEDSYRLRPEELAMAYSSFSAGRRWRYRQLSGLREQAIAGLRHFGYEAVDAPHSINVAVRAQNCDNGYVMFRELLRTQQVAVFPGVLTMCLEPGWFRLTTAKPPNGMSEALRRLGLATDSSRGDSSSAGIGVRS